MKPKEQDDWFWENIHPKIAKALNLLADSGYKVEVYPIDWKVEGNKASIKINLDASLTWDIKERKE